MTQIGIFEESVQKRKGGKNGCLLFLILLSAIFLIIGTGCSHVKPYYRSDDLKPSHISIDKNEIKHRVLLIGDAGAPQKKEPVLRSLRKWASQIPDRTTIFFLGDNIYPTGMPEEDDPFRPEAERRIMAQVDVVKSSGAKGIFIPGNHDWLKGREGGYAAIRRQEDFINRILPGDENFLPQNGCPGPVKLDFDDVRIIILDTQWWFEDEKEKLSSDCAFGSEEAVLEELQRLIAETLPGNKVIILGHHTLISYGPHGGYFTLKDHIFPLTRLVDWMWIPLPVIGSIYPLLRSTVLKNQQDIGSDDYDNMKDQLVEILIKNKPLFYASGHSHTLQVLEGGDAADYLVVSGAGSEKKLYDVGGGDETLFAHSHTGFMAVDFLKNGKILLRVVEPVKNEVVLELWLNDSKRNSPFEKGG